MVRYNVKFQKSDFLFICLPASTKLSLLRAETIIFFPDTIALNKDFGRDEKERQKGRIGKAANEVGDAAREGRENKNQSPKHVGSLHY